MQCSVPSMHGDSTQTPRPCCVLLQIRQVSAQVHDMRGRVKRLVKLLQDQGYNVEVYQEPRFAACNLHMLYASRDA